MSTISLVLETGTGLIQTGKRHAFRNRAGVLNTRREEVQLDELRLPNGELNPSSIDCNKGIWRGMFKYADGTTEKFRFSKPGQ